MEPWTGPQDPEDHPQRDLYNITQHVLILWLVCIYGAGSIWTWMLQKIEDLYLADNKIGAS